MNDDDLFLGMMKLFTVSKISVDIRKRIVKGMRAPLSEPALIFLGKRLRDENDEVCCLIFKQFLATNTKLENFINEEARMLVLAEGLQH